MEFVIHFLQHFFAMCGAHSLTHPTVFIVALFCFAIYFAFSAYKTSEKENV